MQKQIDIYLANPRGFCGGVTRAVGIVEQALAEFGAPLFVHHEIVHNKHVVQSLQAKGVIFIDDLAEITDFARPVIISAHGASKKVYQKAAELGIKLIDATCPLVAKVHQKIAKLAEENKNIVVIGKCKHPEIIGTLGQLEDYPHYLVINTPEEAANISFERQAPLGMVTQTTLAVNEVAEVMSALQNKFGVIEALSKSDTCYATTHRQAAIKLLTQKTPIILVVGSKNSSNSLQLQKIALNSGAKKSFLIDDVSEMPWDDLQGAESLGISAGASAPEHLIEEILEELKRHYEILNINDIIVKDK